MKLTKRGAAKLSRGEIELTAPENVETREHDAETESDKILIPVIITTYSQLLTNLDHPDIFQKMNVNNFFQTIERLMNFRSHLLMLRKLMFLMLMPFEEVFHFEDLWRKIELAAW